MADEPRAQVRARFHARCAYCGVHEDAVGATLTIDHHRPRSRGGTDEVENLVYCCARCNEHKGAYWHEHDPPHVRLLHPGQDELAQHLRESDDGCFVGLTPEGEFFIQRLRLNRPQIVSYRRARQAEAKLTAELVASRRRVEELERSMFDLRSALESTADEIERRSKGRR
ncbi:HNH endonuclease [Sorangium sp. So ce131]|uniref:HNH endonuclease n=1 Tax=Sorangium sp. So ce131 TaxID=3133282 RepID=UPI003F63F284